MSESTSQTTSFLNHLIRICDDKANRSDRAALRRYWSPTTRYMAYPVLGKLGALEDRRKCVLAALYAEHPGHQTGQTVGKAALALGKRENGEHPYDRHFRRLLACEELEELGQQLHRLVKRLEREGVGLDYGELHFDLNKWAKHRERVKIDWAAGFWQVQTPVAKLEGVES